MLNLDRSTWRRVKFGDVVSASKEKCDPEADGIERFIAGEHMDTDELRISRWGNVGDGYLGPAFHRRFHTGDILYGSRRTYLRKVAVAEFDGVTANTTFVVRTTDPGILLPDFLPFAMTTESFHQHAIDKSRGSVNPYVNWPDIAGYEFDLPPLDQQRRIADLLWAVEDHKRSAICLLSAARTASDAIFSQRLQTAQTVPCLVQDLVSEAPRNGMSVAPNSEGAGTPTISLAAVRGGRLRTEGTVKYVTVDPDRVASFIIRPDDFLVVRGNGNRDLVARGALVRRDDVPEGCFYPDLLIRVRFDPAKILTDFAARQWNAPESHGRLLSVAKTTSGIYKVNGKDIRAHTLLVPPLSTQRQIMNEAEQVEDACESIQSDVDSVIAVGETLGEVLLGGRE